MQNIEKIGLYTANYTDRMLNLKKQQFQRPSLGNLQQSKLGTWYANCKVVLQDKRWKLCEF